MTNEEEKREQVEREFQAALDEAEKRKARDEDQFKQFVNHVDKGCCGG